MNWKILSIISTAPYIFLNLFYQFVPESIQWLKLHGNTDDVVHIISRIDEWNKKELPDNIVISSSEETSNHKSTPIYISRTRKLAIGSFIQGYLWLVISMGYYGLYMAADDLGGSIYRDVVLLTIADIPALFVTMYLCTRFGRKLRTLIPLLIGGITSIVLAFIPFENNFKIFRMIFGYIGKFFLCLGFNGVSTWSVEIYPTHIRSEGIEFTTVAARIGSALSPWVAKGLKPIGNWFPFVVLGVPSTIAFVIGLWLPETKQKVSPELIKYKRNGEGNVNVEIETKMGTCDIWTLKYGVVHLFDTTFNIRHQYYIINNFTDTQTHAQAHRHAHTHRHTHMHTYTHTHTHTHTCTHTGTGTGTHTHTHRHTHTHAHTHTHRHTHTHTHRHTHMHMHMHMHTHTHMHTHRHRHRNTHTHTHRHTGAHTGT